MNDIRYKMVAAWPGADRYYLSFSVGTRGPISWRPQRERDMRHILKGEIPSRFAVLFK